VKYTKKCVRCLKRPATRWGGIVLERGKRVFAGWCRHCKPLALGFAGHYMPKMGKQAWKDVMRATAKRDG
jgi:hypothetical protein